MRTKTDKAFILCLIDLDNPKKGPVSFYLLKTDRTLPQVYEKFSISGVFRQLLSKRYQIYIHLIESLESLSHLKIEVNVLSVIKQIMTKLKNMEGGVSGYTINISANTPTNNDK